MTVVIHQTYFLPWLGYLSKLAFADTFVVLDDVFFRDRHFHKRTRIINMQGVESFIGLPVGHNFEVPCNQIELKESKTKVCKKLLNTLEMSYKHSDFFNSEWSDIKTLIEKTIYTFDGLVQIDIEIIRGLLNIIAIPQPRIEFSSNFGHYTDPTERFIGICNQLNADTIILGGGKSSEVHDIEKLNTNALTLLIQDYFQLHPTYKQFRNKTPTFVKGLSVVDSLFNVGRLETKKFILDTIYKPQPLN